MSRENASRPLRERFPALTKLSSLSGGARVPFLQQTATADCASACLAMVLRFHGKEVGLEEIRALLGSGREGVDAEAILEAARAHGLRGRGVKLDLADLDYLPAATILHWRFNHFVVFERVRGDTVEIVDPAIGPRRLPLDQFSRFFTGVGLTFERGEGFTPARKGASRLRAYWAQILEQRGVLARVVVTSLLIQLFALATPFLTGALVDRVIPRQDYNLLTLLVVGVVSMAGFGTLASLVRSYLLLQLRTRLDIRMTLQFLDHLVNLPYAFFQQRSAGDLIMRLSSNAVVREILTSTAMSGVIDGALVFLYLVVLLATSASMGALVVALAVMRLAVFVLARRRMRSLISESLQTQASLQNYQVQMLAGIETLKSSGVEQRAVDRWSNLYVDALNASLARSRLQLRVESAMGAMGLLSPLLFLGYGGYQVLSGSLTLGSMLALNALAAGFLGPLSSLVGTALRLQEVGSYMERINDVLDTEPEQAAGDVVRAGRLEGCIRVEDVSFRYGPKAPLVVRDVSLELAPGQFVAIVGASGSGKSTLGKLLLGLYRPDSGRILYDGIDLARLECRSVRRQLGIVPQHPYLFGATVRENIALSDPSLPLEKVIEAARRAEIHEDIVAMPLGYETVLADGGASLAAGQRQRIALARALVQDPVILLLDEATSALDAVTESKVVGHLAELRCARFVIAHRMSTIVQADMILVMEEGSLVEQGTHDDLLAAGGRYARMFAGQLVPEVRPS